MSPLEAGPDFEVGRFEAVQATPGTTLLRLAGRWYAREAEQLAPPQLVVDDHRDVQRLDALPGPDHAAPRASPRGDFWRAAYSLPSALASSATFSLDPGGGHAIELPAPRSSAVRTRAREQAPVRVGAAGAADAGELAVERERRERAERQIAALEADGERARAAAESADDKIQALVEELREARRLVQQRGVEIDALRAELATLRSGAPPPAPPALPGTPAPPAMPLAPQPQRPPARVEPRRLPRRWRGLRPPSETALAVVLLAIGFGSAATLVVGIVHTLAA